MELYFYYRIAPTTPAHFLRPFQPRICKLPLCGISYAGALLLWRTVRMNLYNFRWVAMSRKSAAVCQCAEESGVRAGRYPVCPVFPYA
jgi:hypothetical protein